MKKKAILIIIGIVIIYGLYRWSGIFRYFHIATTSNEPNLKLDDRFFGSSLIKPERFDFAYFKFSDSLDGYTIVKRLIGLPNDIIQSKNGVIYVYAINVDKEINLRYAYLVDEHFFKDVLLDEFHNDKSFESYRKRDSIMVFLDEDYVASTDYNLNRYFERGSFKLSKDIKLKSNWDSFNFGPIVIPDNKYFFMGDNRDNSFDSRWRGLVDKENIEGTLFYQF